MLEYFTIIKKSAGGGSGKTRQTNGCSYGVKLLCIALAPTESWRAVAD
jgi:hypothetical protein